MFLRSRLIQRDTLTAATTRTADDLPVNPLSAILVTLAMDVDAINVAPTVDNMLAAISRLDIFYKGQNIISGSGPDLAALYWHLTGKYPIVGRLSAEADEAEVWVTLPILFGPEYRNPKWCFPAVRRGELQMQITTPTTFTAVNDVQLQVETVELLDGAPERFLKYTTISKTPTATGDHDVDLPLGNPIRGIQLFGTTVPVDGAITKSINAVRMLVDNVEHGYALANWETIIGERALFRTMPYQAAQAVARLTGGAPAANDDTRSLEWPTDGLRQYAWLDYGQTPDYDARLQTGGKGRVHLRIDAGDTQAIRVIPVEEIAVQGGAPTA